MSNHDLTVTPNSGDMRLSSNTGRGISALLGSFQTIDRGGLKWIATLNFINMITDDRAELMGLIAQLRGQANRVRVPVFDNPARGNYGGTPLVNGGSQTGSDIDIDGVGTVSNWIRKGDYFSVEVNGEHELKMCTEDASSSGGTINIKFEPRLRASPANNAVVYVEDGVLSKPEGLFVLNNTEQGWSSRPGRQSDYSNMTIELLEDVFATQ